MDSGFPPPFTPTELDCAAIPTTLPREYAMAAASTSNQSKNTELFVAALNRLAPEIETGLKRFAWPRTTVPEKLRRAMDYSLFAGGKRLRPALVLLACEACSGDWKSAMPAAVAYEMVHTYSLIHDDLPAMDDDDLRRGKPSSHKAFGEATAILAGDAMLTYAFQLLATEIEDAATSRRLVRMLAEAAGLEGMVAGQQDDLDGEGQSGLGLQELESIHARKTGALIAAALQSGAVIAGASEPTVEVCGAYGRKLGLAFQVADDILDMTATAEQLGKSPGKDVAAGKLTYPGLLGVDGARAQANRLAGEAAALAGELPKGEVLASLAWYVVARGN